MIRKIAFITQAAPWPQNLNFGHFNISQAAALRRLGVECEIFAPMMWLPRILNPLSSIVKRLNSRPTDYEFGGVPIHVIRAPYPHGVFLRWRVTPWAPGLAAASISLPLCARLEKRLRAFKPDLLLVHDGFALGKLGLELSRRIGVPMALIEHDVINAKPDSVAGRWYMRTFAGAKTIFTVSRQSEQHIRENLKLPQAKLVLNGTLTATIEQRGTPRPAKWEGKKLVLAVGGFIPRKGHLELVHAFADANVKGSILLFIGSGQLSPQLQEMIEQKRAGGAQIELLGTMNPQEVQQFMVWADVFALPSWWEAFGLVYAEAMSAETPIILTSDSGMAGEITSGVHGWIVPPREHEPLVAALREALTSADLKSMGRAGRKLVEERFSWDGNAQTVLNTLNGEG